MKNEYSFKFAPEVIFGCSKRNVLHEKLAGFERKMLICGRHFAQSRIFKEIFSSRNDYFVHIVESSEPTLDMVAEALEYARINNVQSIVSIGGGSVIDIGKTVAGLFNQPGSVEDYFYCRMEPAAERIFFCALPTTAGTGAEVTPNAVLSDTKTNIKQSIRGRVFGVDLAIVDPELTYDCPLSLVRYSGMDALTQAIEAAISNKSNNLTFGWSMESFRLIFENLRAACDGDLEAKNAVSEGTLIGAMAFPFSGLGAVHGLAHPIGSLYHLPHGFVCGVLLVHILKINRNFLGTAAAAYYGREGTPEKLLSEIAALADDLEIPRNLKGYLKKEDFPFIIQNCRSGSMKCNPVALSDSDIEELLESLI